MIVATVIAVAAVPAPTVIGTGGAVASPATVVAIASVPAPFVYMTVFQAGHVLVWDRPRALLIAENRRVPGTGRASSFDQPVSLVQATDE